MGNGFSSRKCRRRRRERPVSQMNGNHQRGSCHLPETRSHPTNAAENKCNSRRYNPRADSPQPEVCLVLVVWSFANSNGDTRLWNPGRLAKGAEAPSACPDGIVGFTAGSARASLSRLPPDVSPPQNNPHRQYRPCQRANSQTLDL
jgi:hypothetical protein